MMRVGSARIAAITWVKEMASQKSWFRGAYFSGSTVGLSDEAELPSASDIDVVIITSQSVVPLKLGKFTYHGTLIEVTYLSWEEISSFEEVLTSYHLAGSFRIDTIISDPTGHLSKLQSQIGSRFSKQKWVRQRCENALLKIENGLKSIDPSQPWHDQVTSWLFPTAVTTHVILVAALRNPTVRLRYLAAREVLLDYDSMPLYEELLELLGCAHLSRRRVEYHLKELAHTFDATMTVAKTPFFFSSDITAPARPIAIDGSLNLIKAGFHREAVFWIVATFARCHKILAADASVELQNEYLPAFHAVVSDLGIFSYVDLINRAENVLQFLPKLRLATEEIICTNPKIFK